MGESLNIRVVRWRIFQQQIPSIYLKKEQQKNPYTEKIFVHILEDFC